MSEAYLGEIRMFAGDYVPENWTLCDGKLLPVSTNQSLFSLLGTLYGGNGQTNFAVPNLCGRIPVGQGEGTGLAPWVVGQTAGVENVTLTSAHTPAHSHTFTVSKAAATTAAVVETGQPNNRSFGAFKAVASIKGLYSAGTGTSAPVTLIPAFLSAEGGQPQQNVVPHSNMMGSLAINYIMCMVGFYPTRP